jgi:quercetin dioxygenase-like cupin family protein
MSYLVEFDKISWNETSNGMRTKTFINENQQIRLVEFSEGFIEKEWCQNGHVAYVIKGEFSIDYSGIIERYKVGDVIFIPKGEQAKHKAILREGEKVTLLLFEIIGK